MPAIMDRKFPDQIVAVSGASAMAVARLLASQEGILVGTSAGGTVAAALEVAKTAPAGSHILAMLPDTGERYLVWRRAPRRRPAPRRRRRAPPARQSTPLFEKIVEGQDPDVDKL